MTFSQKNQVENERSEYAPAGRIALGRLAFRGLHDLRRAI